MNLVLVKMIICGILVLVVASVINHAKLVNIQILNIVDAKNFFLMVSICT